MFQIESCAKLQVKINKLCKQRVSAIDSNILAQPFQMAVSKSLEMISAMILN